MKYTLILALIASIVLAGCGGEKTKAGQGSASPSTKHPLPGDPVAGEAVYKRICIACHQADGSGLNGMLAANFVSEKERLAKSNKELLKSIREGITKDNRIMPPQKGILTEKEMADALSYVRKTFGD